ncbi:MAG TPA: histidine phosphatase family protein [Phenylobacterium sp.]|nr:histidine phosphatase family protein [Phenylobacterium sp.]
MPRLYLIRHGKPSATWGGGDDDPGLDDTGAAQARAARDWLLALPQAERPKRVVSSPLRRCRETAEPTAQALGVAVEIDPIVGEIPTPQTLNPLERGSWLRQVFAGSWSEIKGDLDYDQWRLDVVGSLRARGDTAVFSHYVAINAVVSHLLGEDRVLAFRPDHASITVLETDGRDLALVAKGREAATGVL